MGLRSAPKLTVSTSESLLYQTTGFGLTDSLFLVGHSDGLELNDPHKVTSMSEALDLMGRDSISPLAEALLKAYYAGARDIWIVATAPLEEYEPDLDLRDAAYYEAYYDRLATTYDMLKYQNDVSIIVPVDAPFNTFAVDFTTQLVNFCIDSLNLKNQITIGIMGTRGVVTDDLAAAMATDPRLNNHYGARGKYVSVFAGEGSFNFRELEFNGKGSFAPVCAATLARMPLNKALTYGKFKGGASLIGDNVDDVIANGLAEKGVNLIVRNTKGRRGVSNEVVAIADNTLSEPDTSDYWSLATTRLISQINDNIVAMGDRIIGTISRAEFEEDVRKYLHRLTTDGIIRSYSVNFYVHDRSRNRLYVDLVVRPYTMLRDVNVDIEIGPGGF